MRRSHQVPTAFWIHPSLYLEIEQAGIHKIAVRLDGGTHFHKDSASAYRNFTHANMGYKLLFPVDVKKSETCQLLSSQTNDDLKIIYVVHVQKVLIHLTL